MIKKHGPKSFQTEWAPRFPAFSTLGVLGIIFVVIALKANELGSGPAELLHLILPLLALYGIIYVLSTLVARLELVYGTLMRNLSIALALAMNAFGEAARQNEAGFSAMRLR